MSSNLVLRVLKKYYPFENHCLMWFLKQNCLLLRRLSIPVRKRATPDGLFHIRWLASEAGSTLRKTGLLSPVVAVPEDRISKQQLQSARASRMLKISSKNFSFEKYWNSTKNLKKKISLVTKMNFKVLLLSLSVVPGKF